MRAPLVVIGAPSSAGAYAPGQERAPEAFRRHGLLTRLQGAGHSVRDAGDVAQFRWRPDATSPQAANLAAVRAAAVAVSHQVADGMARGESAIVLGGDCTVELGTVAGVRRDGASVGLVYLDLDVDLNPPAASDGALDWTVTAHLLDLAGTAPELSGLGPRRPMLAADQLLFLGADNITAPERATIEALGLGCVRLAEVRADPAAAGQRAAAWAQRFDRLLVHLDSDVLEYTSFPIAENVRREPGLTLDQLAGALVPLLRAPNWRALTICEVNPDHAPDEKATFAALIPALFSAFLQSR